MQSMRGLWERNEKGYFFATSEHTSANYLVLRLFEPHHFALFEVMGKDSESNRSTRKMSVQRRCNGHCNGKGIVQSSVFFFIVLACSENVLYQMVN